MELTEVTSTWFWLAASDAPSIYFKASRSGSARTSRCFNPEAQDRKYSQSFSHNSRESIVHHAQADYSLVGQQYAEGPSSMRRPCETLEAFQFRSKRGSPGLVMATVSGRHGKRRNTKDRRKYGATVGRSGEHMGRWDGYWERYVINRLCLDWRYNKLTEFLWF